MILMLLEDKIKIMNWKEKSQLLFTSNVINDKLSLINKIIFALLNKFNI